MDNKSELKKLKLENIKEMGFQSYLSRVFVPFLASIFLFRFKATDLKRERIHTVVKSSRVLGAECNVYPLREIYPPQLFQVGVTDAFFLVFSS